MEIPSERTPLRHGDHVPPYVFITAQNRVYRNKVRKFQCCICAGMLAIFITALVITVSYSVNHDEVDGNTTTTTITPNPAENDTLTTLLLMSWPIKDKHYPEFDDPLNDTEIATALSEGHTKLLQKENFEDKVPALQVDSPSYRHQMATKTSPKARELSRAGFIMEYATKTIYTKRPKVAGKRSSRKIHSELLPEEVCKPTGHVPCDESPYRTADGSCNNLDHPRSWGVAMRPFRRILPPEYADGVSAPRKAQDGSGLPPARQISLTIHRPFYRDDPNFTVMLAVWGQFIDHDITATALSQGKSGNTISCCYAFRQSGIVNHPECYTVSIQTPDPYYDQYNVSCMEFVRSSPSPTCSFGPREQMNQATSFLDASVVYGTSQKMMDQLRTFTGGELKMLLAPDGRELLPISTDPNDGCNQEEQLKQGRYCFLSGDARSNENVHLTTMHLLFARQHNQITRKLSEMNPKWNDEKLFQEARKILSAELQHITYNEFLSVILGPRLMEKLKMSARDGDYSDVYDSGLDPTIANSFAASAFRFGHTLLPGLVRMIAGDYSSEEYVEMHKMLFNPFELHDKGFLEKAVRGAMSTHVEKVDTYFNPEFTRHLFERKPSLGQPRGMCGLDLVSLNVQRGRDHGLPGYPSFREHCGLNRPQTFEDLELIMDSDSLQLIKQLYKTVDDIDMYTGALAEIPLQGSLLGPTVTCLITDQFLRLQRGDRFWYETAEQPQAFTPAQLNAIRKMTLARLICDTSGVTQAQPKVMEGTKPGNERQNCQDLPELDLTPWQENSQPTVETLNNPAKIWLIKSSNPSTPQITKLSGHVESGNITVEGITIWSGTPLKFPTELFQAVADFSQNVAYPPVYSHGIRWSAEGQNIINGNFSFPFYTNGKVIWYNGNFSLQVRWDKNDLTPIHGDYSSPLYFNSGFSNSAPGPEGSLQVPSRDFPSLTVTGQTAPVILDGVLTPDGKFFSFSGNFTLILPKPKIPQDNEIMQLGYTPTSYTRYVKIGGKVSGGSVSAQGQEIWTGNLPMAIPVDPFDTIADTSDSSENYPVVYGHGINWKGSVISNSANSGTLSGSFSLPIFVHSNGIAPFSIRWYNGDCSIDFDILWQSNSDVIVGNFTTNVYFADRKQYEYLKDTDAAVFPSVDFAGSPKQFEGPRSKLILLGTYSKNGQTFIWSGNFTLILPEKIPITGVSLNNQRPLRLIGGHVSVDDQNIWYNTLPLGIPISDSSRKMLWTGSVQPFGDGFIKILGSFSFPSDIDSWVNGKFDLQFQSNKTFALSGQFSTTIRLAEIPLDDAYQGNSLSHLQVTTTSTPKENGHNLTNLSVTLLGMFSLDRSEFLWSGQCILEIPRAVFHASWIETSRIKINGIVKNTGFGVPPKNIPLTLFESVLTTSSTGNEPPVYGQGILWTGSFVNKTMLFVKCSLPKTTRGKLTWHNSNFSVDVDLTTVPNLQKGQTFSSVVFLKGKKSNSEKVSDNELSLPDEDEPAVNPDTLQSAPIILYGEYSHNKQNFRWNGEITIILPNSTEEEFFTKSSDKLVISAFAKGGSITTSGAVTWVGNRVPLAVPAAFLQPFDTLNDQPQGYGVPWQGFVASDAPNTVKIWGKYSVSKGVDWYNGDFAFELKLLGGLTTNVNFNGTFMSYFYYHEVKANSVLNPEWTLAVTSLPTALPQTLPNNTESVVPVVLHGTFSDDGLLFIWSGNVTVIVQNSLLV